MKWPDRRSQKPLLVVIALLGALALTFLRESPPGLAHYQASIDDTDDDGGGDDDALGFRLRILSRVIMLIHERYIEPDRIDQRAMLLGGLDYIQRSAAEVLLRHDEGADVMTIQVNDAEQTFSLADLDRPWALTFRFREVFRFLRANLRDENVDLREIEYAACNGVLHTLDPHSVLLVPELYEEMRLGTRGEFGGLGIVISIRDGQLTIISPIDGTPAARAGLRRMDRIAMIGDETTINMTLEEAVDRLRGPPGSTVSIRIMRRGWTEPHPFNIVRAVIRIESVESELLPGGVGYIKIRSFQGNTHDDLIEHLGRLRSQGMRSLILDLRDDPGGLLDQAIRVADTFLPEGVIVTTAGNDPEDREVRRAHAENTEPNYPMVVLVNSGSASASEIVAGALKYNNRAVIVGERTFGKGSVQVLYDFDDGSALKLTIAHYLTPGDISIQSVGIVPDIEVLPLLVRRGRVDLIPDESSMRESSLEAHLAGQADTPRELPAYQLHHYNIPETAEPQAETETSPPTPPAPEGEGEGEGEGERPPAPEADDDEDDEAEEARNRLDDFEIRLAHDLLRRGASPASRQTLVERAAPLIESRQATEQAKLVTGLRRLGVDWSEGRDRGPTKLEVQVSLSGTNDDGHEVEAGGRLELTLQAKNLGEVPIYQLHALTKSDNPYFDDRELPLGHLDPGETRSWTLKQRIPRDSNSRSDPIRLTFTELHGHAPPPQEVELRIRGLERPTFSYAFQVVDTERGNGDGRLNRGERVRLLVTVTNQGPGQTFSAQVNIKNESGEGLLIHDGRFEIGQLGRGEGRSHAFEFEVLPSFEESEVELELTITDFELREEVTESLRFPLLEAVGVPSPASGHRRATERAPVYEWPAEEAHQVGWVPADGVYAVGAERGEFLRLSLGEERTGWVRAASLAPAEAPPQGPPGFEIRMDNTPPDVAFAQEPPLLVSGDHLSLRGVVSDADRVLDMYIFVGRHKDFYLSNREGEDLRRLTFDANLPLEEGSNIILLVARESGEVVARRIMIVRRSPGPAQQARGQSE